MSLPPFLCSNTMTIVLLYATQPISSCVFLSVEMNKRNYKREEESLTQTAARLEIGIYNCVPATVVTILSVQSQFCVLDHTRHILGSRNNSV